MVIEFDFQQHDRNQYYFKNAPVLVETEYGDRMMYPCIVLREVASDATVAFPKFERWYLRLVENEHQSSTTLRKRAAAICEFLNYVLHETQKNRLSEVDSNTIHGFVNHYRVRQNGEPRSEESWNRGIVIVYEFLACYRMYNKDQCDFAYSEVDLYSEANVWKEGRYVNVRKCNKYSVTKPDGITKRYRFLVDGYLDVLIFEARKYDPMIALAIVLQAYAGLREGEIVNLTRSSITTGGVRFGRAWKMYIDLRKPAKFAVQKKGKSEFGSIKVPRKQEVYPKFIKETMKMLADHESMLDGLGASDAKDAPLFINKKGGAMSVTTYCQRLEKLFKEHFLPALRRLCDTEDAWAEHAPFIEKYEKQYPGAHMLRHWFTMHLLTRCGLQPEIVSKWRGDRSVVSIASYMHINGEMIDLYRDTVITFQKQLLEEVL